MQTAQAIAVHHYRNDYVVVGEEFILAPTSDLGELPPLWIKSLSIDKTSQKVYSVESRRKTTYIPTGMVGPQVQLICSCTCDLDDYDLFTNDILQVVAFGFPTWAKILKVNSTWWIDTYSCTASVEKPPRGGKIRYEVNLTLYKRADIL